MKNLVCCIFITLIFSGCASLFSAKTQRIIIDTDKETKIMIDGSEPLVKKGKVVLRKEYRGHQIRAYREGYKDENIVLFPYKRPIWYWLDFNPIGLFLLTPGVDNKPNAKRYDKEIEIGYNLEILPEKDTKSKNININEVAVDLPPENIRYRNFYSYKYYLRNHENKASEILNQKEGLKYKSLSLLDLFNDLLKEKGYIDTSAKLLKNSYQNNVYVNVELDGIKLNNVENYNKIINETGFVYVELSLVWKALDFYKKEIFSYKNNPKSGQFAYNSKKLVDKSIQIAIKDALEYGLLDFMNTKELDHLLKDTSRQEIEASYKLLSIPKANQYVGDLKQAIKSSVTIRHSDGSGSGFFISPDGYLISNYHVIAGAENITVITNDKKEYKAEIIRESRLYDLALLKIDIDHMIPFSLSKNTDFELAEEIFVIGTPNSEDLSQTISKGIISGIRTAQNSTKLIQTDASINPGNSGGAMILSDGQAIGVVASKLTGFGIEGVAFGIPAYEIFESLMINIE